MKKTTLTVLVLALALAAALALGACGTAQPDPAPPAAQVTPAGNVPPADTGTQAADEITDISWFISAGVVPSTWDTSQYVMRGITERTGVTVSAMTPAEDADTRLNLMIVSGDLPDIITIANHTLIREMIMAGMVYDIQTFYETYLPDSHLIHGGFPPDIRERLIARDGGWYTIPSHMLSSGGQEIWGLHPSTEQLWLDARYRTNIGIIFYQRHNGHGRYYRRRPANRIRLRGCPAKGA